MCQDRGFPFGLSNNPEKGTEKNDTSKTSQNKTEIIFDRLFQCRLTNRGRPSIEKLSRKMHISSGDTPWTPGNCGEDTTSGCYSRGGGVKGKINHPLPLGFLKEHENYGRFGTQTHCVHFWGFSQAPPSMNSLLKGNDQTYSSRRGTS